MIQKLGTMFSKGLGFIYVYLRYHLRNKNKIVKNKNILIIFGGHLGNAVLNIDLILKTKEHYKREDGWNIFIFCHDSNRKILEKFEGLDDVQFLDISYPYKDGGTKFASVYGTLRKMKGMEFDKIIVNLAHIMPLAAYVVATVPCNDSIGVFDNLKHTAGETRNIEHNVGNARWYFQKAYKSPILVDYNTQEVARQKLILKQLGIEYKVRVYPIRKLCEFECNDKKYFTVTVDSATQSKRWSPENFAELINRICGRYEYDVCITGGAGTEDIYERLEAKLAFPERAHNFIGKTNFDQWVELIRGSSFHVGVDSASIHIASSVGTQAFCLIGVWDGTRVLPYQIEEENGRTCSPICIYMDGAMDLNCYGCYPKRGLIGSGNEECLNLCRNGDVCWCLKSIPVDKVFYAVDGWLRKNR